MANVTVTGEWLREHSSFDTQVDEPEGGFEVSLTAHGVQSVEKGQYRGTGDGPYSSRLFHVMVPGLGWCECFAKNQPDPKVRYSLPVGREIWYFKTREEAAVWHERMGWPGIPEIKEVDLEDIPQKSAGAI